MVLFVAFGFGIEDEFGFSGKGVLDFGGGVGEAAADGAFEAVDGDHDAAAGDLGVEDAFQDVFVDAVKIPAALFEEAGGVGVIVDGVAVVKTLFAGDACGAIPLDELEFDPDAIGVVADATSAAMGGGWLGCGDRETGDFG
jgi:hypothetical protein